MTPPDSQSTAIPSWLAAAARRPRVIGNGPTVLQVLPSLKSGGGGVEQSTLDIASALAGAGWRPVVASAGGDLTHDLVRIGAPHVTLALDSKNPITLWHNISRLEYLMAAHDVRLIHARSRAPAWSAYFAAKRTRRPFITTVHGTYNANNPLKHRYNRIMTEGDRVIANSEFTAAYVRQHYGIDDRRLRVIPRGIDMVRFDPSSVSTERVIKLVNAWRLPEDLPVVLLPGRLTRWKGQTVLIDALARLGRRDLRCVLVGSDQGRHGYRQELEAKTKSLGLSDIIQIVPHCADIPAAYKLASVVVSASTDPEAFGRIAVEAQAMERPIIATDHGGSRETVKPGAASWLTPPGGVAALAEALSAALSLTPDLKNTATKEAAAFVRQHYDRDLMGKRTLAVYDEVLSQGSFPK
ncbi:MAG: glycosyltransferase family 4 protein [Alphaproteobacteria bacterium]